MFSCDDKIKIYFKEIRLENADCIDVAGFCEHGNETIVFHKMRGIS